MANVWRPLSERGTEEVAEEVLYEGVPPHLRNPLVHWLECQFWVPSASYNDGRDLRVNHERGHAKALRIASRLRLTLEPASLRYGGDSFLMGLIELAKKMGEVQLLNVIDAALVERTDPEMQKWDGPHRPEDLDAILRNGGSAYRVNDRGDGLERRVSEAVQEAARRAMASTKDGHLATAWRAAYGIHPEPTVAYAEAVKAIEAAVVPVVLANDATATLGKAIGELRANNAGWKLAIVDPQGKQAGPGSLVSLLELVWQGHRDRHAGTATNAAVTAQAAEMAVHAAVLVVQWLTVGGLRK